ncbi:MAG: PH domain-containing protein [Tannerella sp.]|jgi:hypothetical protein|nr:PH domain-containing protein [Tannerella sp.]
MDKKVFRSRVSVALVGFLLAVFILTTSPMFYCGAIGELYILGGAFLFCVLIFAGMRYVVAGDKLYINIIWIIPYGKAIIITDILSVKRSYNLLSAPAASLKRLSVRSKKSSKKSKHSYLLISPAREQEFLDTLRSINPDIDIQVSDKKGKWRVRDWDI